MPNESLASLVVSLILNTASFEEGTTKAQRLANKAAKDIDREFRSLQGALSGVFARLGPIGASAAAALDQIGGAASSAMSKLGPLGKEIGLLGAGVAGLGVAAAAASIGVIGIAAHAAESAAKLEDLSHSTGVSVEALSQLQAVGHMIAPDVDIDTLAKGLERFGRATLVAATASTTMITPFQRLGIAVKDANGQIRPTEDLLADVASKFSGMADGAAKTGLAMQLFGRSGAGLLPIFDEGGERMRQIIELATQMGAVIGTGTAEAAHKFKENISALELAFQGLENQIMAAMLPALTELTNRVVAFFSETTPQREKFIHDLTDMAKAFLELAVVGGEALRLIANNLGAVVDVMEIFSHGEKGLGTVLEEAGQRTVAWARDTVDILKGVPSAMNLGGAAKTPFDQLDEMEGRLKAFDRAHGKGVNVNLESSSAKQAQLTIQEQIQKLEAQATAEGLLAQAISEESSATIENIAHSEALKTISEMNAQAQKYGVSVTEAQARAIEQATLRLEAYKAALKVNKDLEDNIDKTKLAAEATLELAAAYGQGGAAIEQAQEKMKLSTLADAVKDLEELHDKLGQLPMTGKSAELFNTLGESLDQAKDKLASAALQEHAKAMADAALSAAKLGDNLRFETGELEKQIAATLQGADALRTFNAQKQIDVFVHEHPGVLTPDQIAGLRQQAASIGEAEEALQVAQQFRSQNNVKAIGDEIAELTKYHDLIVRDSNDELVYQARMHDLLVNQQKAWDELLLKTNDAGAGVRAFFDDMAFDGQTAAERVHDALTSTFNTLEDTFSRFVSGQKVGWKELENQIVATLSKQSIDVLLRGGLTAIRGKIVGGLGGQQEAMNEKIPGVGPIGMGSTIAALFGIGGKANLPDGSRANPLHVMVVGGVGASGAALPSGLPGIPEFPSATTTTVPGLPPYITPFLPQGIRLPMPATNTTTATEAANPLGALPNLSSLPLAPAPPAVQEALGLPAASPVAPVATSASVFSQITKFLPSPLSSITSLFSGAKPSASAPTSQNVLATAASSLTSSAAKLMEAAKALSSAAQSMNSQGGGAGVSSMFSSDSSGGSGGFLSQVATVLPFLTAAEGGAVSGPGTSTSDSIPAMLSAGEYVVKADAVRRVGKSHLDAINSGRPLLHFALGGEVAPGRAFLASEGQPFVSMPAASPTLRLVDDRSGSNGMSEAPVFNFHGVADGDTFKRSKSQMGAWYQEQMYSAGARQR